MTHNRKSCAALFLESDYDALTLEAYWEARVTTARLKNGRYPFSCIFCKEVHKDKNMTSYHRMFNLCKVYKNPTPLKMYPTWEKSNHGELTRIAQKYGRVYQHNIVPKPHACPKRKAEDDLQLPPSKYHNIDTNVVPKSQVWSLHNKPRPKMKIAPQHVKFTDAEDSEEQEVLAKCEGQLDKHSEEHLEMPSKKEDKAEDTSSVSSPNSPNVRCSYLDTTSDEDTFHVIRHRPTMRTLTREDIEERAWVKARVKFPDGDYICVPPPPTPVDISGLYILITEVDVDWMPKDLINDPQGCIQFLYKMVEEGTLAMKLAGTFGEWYLNDNAVCVVIVLTLSFHVIICHSSFVIYFGIRDQRCFMLFTSNILNDMNGMIYCRIIAAQTSTCSSLRR